MPPSIDTLGHSSRPLPGFLDLLRAHGVRRIIDVRAFPGSRAHPHFNQDNLASALPGAGIAYTHAPGFGGRRSRIPGADPARNAGWENQAFHNFADYAQTPEFRAALDALDPLASTEACALMCSEAVWWRCHRRIITDYLLVRGWSVRHIIDAAATRPASLTPFARPRPDGVIDYPDASSLFPAGTP